MHYLPPESAVVRTASDSPSGWDVSAYLLADLFHAFTGNAHPARPTGKAKEKRYADLRARLEAQRERMKASPPGV